MPSRGHPLVTVLLLLSAPAALGAQEKKPAASFTLATNQDNFFGFYPTFAGTYEVAPRTDFAFYGILWTIPAFNVGGPASGGNLWTEFGAGVRFRSMQDKLAIKPQLGFTHGSLLSGAPTGGSPNAFDGVVPSLTVNYADARYEAEWYSGYYRALRSVGPVQLDFIHFWANAGVKFAKIVSVGGHYEQLRNSRTTAPGGRAANTYQWLGGYVQFALPMNVTARFTTGANILDGARGDFYKLSAAVTF
ncbi:MAG: DUF6733 family protein [Gemmatimonadales bacterium]|nr:DUF6733 family protein [Gemmatimonadales bacterium]